MVISTSFFDEERKRNVAAFYDLIAELTDRLRGPYLMSSFRKNIDWPHLDRYGVYFFQDPSEPRDDTGEYGRIVRVGKAAAQRSGMRDRLYNHKGHNRDSGGQHRASDFRKDVGSAIIRKEHYQCLTWGVGRARPKDHEKKEREIELEKKVSNVIRSMYCTWVVVEGEDLRDYIEQNFIALLSNYERMPVNAPSSNWLGRYSDTRREELSGLWCSNYVDKWYSPKILDTLARLIQRM